MPSCTIRRLVALHTSPLFQNIPNMIHSTACSRSQSSKTMIALLPPSSRVVLVTRSEAAFITRLPVSKLPVNASLSTSAWLVSAAPASRPPVTTFNTPAGSPASCAICANSRAVSGVNSEGLRTLVQPAASAGATFQHAINSG